VNESVSDYLLTYLLHGAHYSVNESVSDYLLS